MDSFAPILQRISTNLLKSLCWVQQTIKSTGTIDKLPLEFTGLINDLKFLYVNGHEAVEPGRYDALDDFGKTFSNYQALPRSRAEEMLRLVFNCLNDNWKGPFLVNIYVEVCKDHLNQLQEGTQSEKKKWFDFLKSLAFVILHYKAIVPRKHGISVASLCFDQIRVTLPMLVIGIMKNIKVIKDYTSKCLMECIETIQKESCEASTIACSEFLDVMDAALNLLDEVIDDCNEWKAKIEVKTDSLKHLIDELLCYAMATAQVADGESNMNLISIKSQAILKDFENLHDELIMFENIPMIGLCANSLMDRLCDLESAVNTTVLKLVVDVFSGIDDPLIELVNKCKTGVKDSGTKKASDLDLLVTRFDSHLDKLMQIGSFAISCSSNSKKVVQIKSCLASFESVETELVSSVTALYMDSGHGDRQPLRYFVEHWQHEMERFCTLLQSIVDPVAYIQVVKEILSDSQAKLNENSDPIKSAGELRKMAKISSTLKGVISASVEQDNHENGLAIKQCDIKVQKYSEKCRRASHLLSSGVKKDGLTDEVQKRVTKLMREIDKLYDCFLINALHTNISEVSQKDQSLRNELTPLPGKYLNICPAIENTDESIPNKFATPAVAAGGYLKKAMLYNTPKRSAVKNSAIKMTPFLLSAKRTPNITMSANRTRCFKSEKRVARDSDASDMQLTQLLDNLTHLDTTFNLHETPVSKTSPLHHRQLLHLFSCWDSESEPSFLQSSTCEPVRNGSRMCLGSTLSSGHVVTPERMQDLNTVEAKINALKCSAVKAIGTSGT